MSIIPVGAIDITGGSILRVGMVGSFQFLQACALLDNTTKGDRERRWIGVME